MESLIVSAFLSSALPFSTEVVKNLLARLSEAKEDYRETIKVEDNSPLEKRRQFVLENLTSLQTEIITSQNEKIIQKVLPSFVSFLISAYEARSEQELRLIELSLDNIGGALRLDKKAKVRRSNARTLAIVVSLFALGFLGALIGWGARPGGPSSDYVLPIIEVPLPILIWSTIGSFTAIIYRFNKSGDIELQDPLRWLFTRPLTGIVMGVIVYFSVKIGLLSTITSTENIEYGELEILWLIAFIGGFSDKFADTVLRALVGQLGGDGDSEVLSLGKAVTNDSSLNSLIGVFSPANDFISRLKHPKGGNTQKSGARTDSLNNEATSHDKQTSHETKAESQQINDPASKQEDAPTVVPSE